MNRHGKRIGVRGMRCWNIWAIIALTIVPLAAGVQQSGQAPQAAAGLALKPAMIEPLRWRSIGPSVMAAGLFTLRVVEKDPTTFWVAPATGGLWKTVNAGVTFEPQFQQEGSISIGAVTVAPSDPNIVWVGTGEANPVTRSPTVTASTNRPTAARPGATWD